MAVDKPTKIEKQISQSGNPSLHIKDHRDGAWGAAPLVYPSNNKHEYIRGPDAVAVQLQAMHRLDGGKQVGSSARPERNCRSSEHKRGHLARLRRTEPLCRFK